MDAPDTSQYAHFARSLGTTMDYASGDVVFREDDPPRHVFFVLSGSVEVSVRGRAIETIGAGRAVGLLGMVDELPRSITAVAREPCELAVVDKKKFRFMVEEAPNFVWFVLAELGSRLRAANAAI